MEKNCLLYTLYGIRIDRKRYVNIYFSASGKRSNFWQINEIDSLFCPFCYFSSLLSQLTAITKWNTVYEYGKTCVGVRRFCIRNDLKMLFLAFSIHHLYVCLCSCVLHIIVSLSLISIHHTQYTHFRNDS